MSVSVGELYATLKLEKGAFDRNLHSSGLSLGSFAKLALGSGAIIGGALVGIGVEATKGAASFQSAMELISTQAGASQTEVDSLSKSVLALAGQVGTAPEELAKGLYHLESAGLHGAQAMDVLKIAAEGAEVGHADLESVTNALVASLKSGVGGITDASQAMGVLNAIVGAGNMRMEDLTAAIGTGVLSAAKNFGVTIQSVGGALAAMTDQGIPAVDAANAIRSAMRLMAAPTKAAVGELKSIGLSSTSLAKDLRGPGGIQAAMIDLRKHMVAAGLSATEQAQLLTKAFGGKQSGGILTLVGNLSVLDAKQKAVNAGVGGFADAWAKTQADVSVKAAKAGASLSALGITLGDKLLPVAAAAFDGLTALLSSPALTAAIENLGTLMGGVADVVGKAFGDLGAIVGPPLGELLGLLADASDGSNAISDDLREMASNGEPLAAVLSGIGDVFAFLSGTVLPKISAAFDVFTTKVLPPLLAIGSKLATDLLPVARTLGTVVGTVLTAAFDALAPAMAALGVVVQAMADNMGIVEPIVVLLAGALGGVLVVALASAAVGFAVTAATAIAAAIATAAAWLIAMAPLLLIGAAIAAVVVIWLNFHDKIVAIIGTIATAIGTWIGGVRDTLVGAWNGIVAAVGTVLGTLSSLVSAGFGAIYNVAATVWNGIRDVIRAVLTVILVTVTIAVAAVSAVINAVWGAIGPFVLGVMDAIRDGVSAAWNAIASVVSTVLGAIESVVSTIWHAIASVIGGVIGAITGTIGTGVHTAHATVSSVFGAIRTLSSTIWHAISSVIGTVWGTITGAVRTAVGTVQTIVSTVWNAISDVTSTVWNGILDVISGVVRAIEGVANGLAGFLGPVFNTVADVVKAPMNAIIGAIDAFIRWWDSVSFSVPGIDLGPVGKIGGFNVSLPYLSQISYLATGGIVSSPTLAMLGENARPEAVIPLDSPQGRALFGRGSSSGPLSLGPFVFNGIGDDVSLERARRFGQAVADTAASALRDQTYRSVSSRQIP